MTTLPFELDQNHTASDEKRRYPRFSLRAYAALQYSTKTWEAEVLDVSETGIRLALTDEHLFRKGDDLRIHIDVQGLNLVTSDKKRLDIHGTIAHVHEQIIGCDFVVDTPTDKTVLYELLMFIENQ